MKSRLGFAINLCLDPDILIIDEALSVGDASFKVKCKNKIKEIRDRNVTVLYVSHNAASVKEICPRSIYLKKGVIVFDGPTEETHLIYLLDKRTMALSKIKDHIAHLESIVNGVNHKNSAIVEMNTLEKQKVKMEAMEKEIEETKQKLEQFRVEYYGSK